MVANCPFGSRRTPWEPSIPCCLGCGCRASKRERRWLFLGGTSVLVHLQRWAQSKGPGMLLFGFFCKMEVDVVGPLVFCMVLLYHGAWM